MKIVCNGSQKSTGKKETLTLIGKEIICMNITINKMMQISFFFKKINLSVNEREYLRKLVKKYLKKNPNMKNSDIVNHFVNTGYARRTVNNTK